MADKKEIEIKLSSDNQVNDYELSKEYADKIIKEITNLKDTRDFVSLKGFLDTRFGKHDYKTINKFLQDFLEQQKAIVISATQLAHLSETGYKGLTEELNALKEQEKKAIGKQKREIQEIIFNKEEELRNSINKSPVGTEAHKLMELHGKGIIDLYDVDNSIKKIYKQINENREIYPELLTLLGRTQKSTDTNFRKQFVVAQQALKLEEQYPLLKGSQRETPRMAATWHNGQLYVIAGTTDASKQEKNKIITEDTKFTSRFKPNYNIAQTASNVNLMRLESGDLDKRAFSYVMYAPTTKNRTLDAFSAPMVFQIGTRSYDEIAKWMHDELDVYEGKKDYKDVTLPGWYVGGSVEKPWTNKEGKQKKTTYWNGKQFKFWLNSKKEEAEQMINSLPEKDKYSFLSLLFGQTKGQFWYDIGNSSDLRDTFLAEYKRLRENEPSYNYYNQDLGGTTIYDKESGSYISIPRESTMESRQKASKDMYEPDVFDIAEEQDIMNLTDDFINHRKPIDAQTAAQMVPVAARRLARVIDYANKVDTVSRILSAQHPELGDDINNISTSLLKVSNLKSLDRYFRSQDLLEKFPQMGTNEEKFRFAISNLRSNSAEESELMSMLETMAKSNEQIDGKSLIESVQQAYLGWADFFNKEQKSVPYPTLQSIITGDLQGYDEEDLRPEYAKRRAAVGDLPVDIGTVSQYLLQLANEEYKNQQERKIAYANRFPKNMEEPRYDDVTFSENVEKYQEDIEKSLSSISEGYKNQKQAVYDFSKLTIEDFQQRNMPFFEDNALKHQVILFDDGTQGELYNPVDSQLKEKVEESSKEITQNIVNNAIDNAVQQTEEVAQIDTSSAKISKEENKPVLKDGVYVWSRTGRRLSAKQLSSRGLQNNPPSGNIQYSGGPIPVYPAGQGGDLDPNKIYKETGITVDAENKIVSRTLKEVQKRKDSGKRGSSQLDVIKQIKEDTGKIVNIMEQQPPVSGGGGIPPIETTIGGSSSASGGSKKGKSKEDKKKEKEEKQAEAQRKRDNQEYAKALKTEYDLRLKIDDARRKSNITSGRERKSQQEFINIAQKQLKIAQVTAQEKRKAVTDKDAALIESGLQGQFSVKRAAMYTKDKGARNIFDLMGDDIKRAFQRITDFGVVARILNKVQKEIANVYQNILKLNEAMTDIRIVTGASVDEANSLMTSYNKLAKELGTTTTEVAKSASEWMRQGYSASESVNLITSSVKLARLGFMDMSSATTSLTAVLKGFNLQATESSKIVDKLTKLDAEYATTAGDIANALSRTAAAAKAANLDLDQTAAMLTTIIDITQQDAGSVGNALKTILSRYGNVKAGVFAGMAEDGEDASESINDVEKVLNAIGIQIRLTSTEMRGFDEVLDDLAEKWDNLNDVEQNAVATAMAGVRQRNQFLALMQNYDQYKESLESSRTSSGTADEKYAAVMDSIATSMQRIQTAWESFTQKLQASGFVKGFFKTIAGVVENIDKMLPGIVATLININAKHLPVLGMKIQGLFGGKSVASNWFKGSFGASKTLVEQQLLEKAKYRAGLIGEENLTPEEKAILSGSKIQKPKSYTEELLQQIADNTAGIKRNTSNGGDDQSSVQDTSIVDVGGGNKPPWIKRFGKSLGRNLKTYGIISGIGAGISAGMTANYGDFTNTGDKVVTGIAQGAATGLISAIPVVGPLLGPILGSFIGQGIGKIFYGNFHKEEIARRARVDEAKKQLEATQKVESAITSAEELTSKDRSEWGSEEYKQEKEYRAQMLETLSESSSLYDNFKKLGGEIKGELTPEVVALYKSAQLMTEAQETYKSKEEERYDLLNKVNSAEYSLIQDIQDDPLNLELRAQYEEKYNKTVEQGVAQFEQLNIKLKTINDNLHETMLKGAFYSGGFSSYTSSDLRNVSLERMVIEQAREWAKKDPDANIFDENGNIYKSAYDTIVSEFKNHENYNVITKKESYNLANSIKNEDWLKRYYKDGISGYNELYQFINTQNEDKIKDFLGVATYEDAKYIIDKINKSNPENISNIAHALNLTADQARGLKDLIGFVTLGDVMSSDTEFLSKFETLGNIFSDLSEDSELTAENLQKIISKYPDFLFGEDGSVSQDNIIKNITSMIANPEGGLGLAYAGKIAKGAQTRTDLWDIFKTSAEKNGISGDVLKKIKDAKDFESANIEWTEELMDMWSSVVAAGTPIETYVNEERDKVIELENKLLDKQIDNLQSIKDQLGDINKQRQKELDLIKARDALENAKKEKKLVYRAGIGFVAQADTSAIQEAQDKVDELERQQTEEDLQYQIDQLNQQKAILEAIQNNESLNALTDVVQGIKDGLGIDENHSNIIDALQKMSSKEYADKIRQQIVDSIKNNTGASNADANNQTKDSSLGVDDKAIKREKVKVNFTGAYDRNYGSWNDVNTELTITNDDDKISSDPALSGFHAEEGVSGAQVFFAKRDKDGNFSKFQHWRDNDTGKQFYKWEDLPDDVLVLNTRNQNRIWYKKDNKLYTVEDIGDIFKDKFEWAYDENGNSYKKYTGSRDNVSNIGSFESHATGSYDYSGGKTYVNELGTEAIVTPQGTLTSLPSHSGIVPADLTKNLFALGEIAPNLIATLRNQMPNVSKSNSTSNDNSTNIGTVYATFNADSGFDMNRFMIDLRSAAGNTRHNN